MDQVQEVISLLRFGGFNLSPQAVVVALDDDLLKLIRSVDKLVKEKGDKLDLGTVKKLVLAFNDKKAKEAEEAEQKAAPVIEK